MVFFAASASASISSIIWFQLMIFLEAVIINEIEEKKIHQFVHWVRFNFSTLKNQKLLDSIIVDGLKKWGEEEENRNAVRLVSCDKKNADKTDHWPFRATGF